MSRRVWWWYLLVMLAGVPVYLSVDGFVQRVLYYAFGFSSIAAIIAGTRMHRPERRWPWLAFACGLFLFAIGDVAFDLYDAAGAAAPVPSAADVLYLAGYPVLAFGMVLLVRYRVRGADLASALDGMTVALGVGVVAWVSVMAPYAHDRSLSVAARVVPIAYPALDLLLVAVVARLLFSRGVRNPAFRLLAASTVALLLADAFYASAVLHDTYGDGSLIDLGWIVSYALWGAAALHPSMSRVADPSPPTEHRQSWVTPMVLTVAALTAPTMLIVQKLRGVHSDEILLGVCSAVMFVLVLVRLSLLTQALDSSNRQLRLAGARQVVLTDAAVGFVGAGDVESVTYAAVSAAVALAGNAETWSSFVATTPGGPTIVAVAGPAPCGVGEPADSELIASWDEWTRASRPALLATYDQETGPNWSSARYVAPVIIGGVLRGILVVTDGPDDAEAFMPVLGLVSSQLGLALQAVEATEERLTARNERQFRSLVQHSSDVVTLIGSDGVVRYQSPGVLAVLGREADDVIGRTLTALIHPDDVPAARAQLTKVLSGGLAASVSVDCRVAHADGGWRDVETVVTNLLDDPDVDAFVLNSRDVTDRRTLEQELNRQTFHDSLTGLANRALFVDRVAHALDRADRAEVSIGVMLLDLDDFQSVNDSLGRAAGDELLVAVAERLTAATRTADTVARLGGDEFAVLIESGDMPEAAHVTARRIAESLKMPIRLGTEEVSVRASIGIAYGHADGPNGLLRDADLAMYMAKRSGKDRFETFRPAMHDDAVRRLELTADLRQALAHGDQLEVFYQPIVDVRSVTAIGAEALVRWHHPSHGLVGPLDFIPIAESTGLIMPLGKWVLNEACRTAQSWFQAGLTNDAFYISVNLSPRQLQDTALLDDVTSALADSGLPPRALVLEVTETVLMEDLDTALARLHALKNLGLRLAVDDFGIGYSSPSYLRDLPIDLVKIDKSFIDRITIDAKGAAMVRSVIDLSAALGLKTIAEGVEHSDQLAVLGELGCDDFQGYLFAKPMPYDQFTAALSDRRHREAPDPDPVLSSALTAS